MKSTPPVHMRQDIKNLVSWSGVDGRIFQDKYINNCNLYKLEPKKNKENKYKVSDKYKYEVLKIIIGPSESKVLGNAIKKKIK